MDISAKIRYLCGLKKISLPYLEESLGFGNGSLSKKSILRSDRLLAIAKYFGVSMEYLMDEPEPTVSNPYHITPHEYEIILAYREADNIDKHSVNRMLNLENREKETATA